MAVQTLHLINNEVGPQTLKSRATDVFHLQAFIFPKVGNAGGGSVALAINVTDSRGVNGPTTVVAISETVPATGSWSMLDGYATVPTGYDTVDPVLTLTSVPITDQVYVDDALVREVSYTDQLAAAIASYFGGTGATNQAAASGGLSAVATTQNYLSAQVAALLAQNAQSTASGLSEQLNFNNFSAATSGAQPSLDSRCSALSGTTVTGTGNFIIQSNGSVNIVQFANGCPANTELFEMYNGGATQTDYQALTQVFTNTSVNANYFVGRANAISNPTRYVLCIVTNGAASLYNVNGATVTQIGSNVSITFNTNSPYEFICGIAGSVRTYQLLNNGSIVASWVDTGAITQVGSGFRYGGFGGKIASASQNIAAVSYFSLADNAAPPIQGSKFKAAAGGSTYSTSGSGNNKLTTYFANVVEKTADITYNAATGIVTVSAAGVYAVKVQVLTSTIFTSQFAGVCVFHSATGVTPTAYQTGAFQYLQHASEVLTDVFFVPCQIGDQIQAGVYTTYTGGSQWTGESSLLQTAFEVVLCNTSVNG